MKKGLFISFILITPALVLASGLRCESLFSNSVLQARIQQTALNLAKFRLDINTLTDPKEKNIQDQEFKIKMSEFNRLVENSEQAKKIFQQAVQTIKALKQSNSKTDRRDKESQLKEELKALHAWEKFIEIPAFAKKVLLNQAQFSGDGSLLLLRQESTEKNFSSDLVLIDTRTWQKISLPTEITRNARYSVLSDDGSVLVLASKNSVMIFDLKNHKLEELPSDIAFQSPTRRLDVSADGNSLALMSENGEVKFYDRLNKKVVSLQNINSSWSEPQVFLSADAKKVVSKTNSALYINDVATGEQKMILPNSSWNRVSTIIQSPDRKWIVAGTAPNPLLLINIETAEFSELPTLMTERKQGLIFSPDGKHLVILNQRDAVVLNLDTKAQITFSIPSHQNSIHDFAISGDGQRLIIRRHESKITTYNLENGDAAEMPFQFVTAPPFKATDPLSGMAAAADNSKIAIGKDDGSVLIWFNDIDDAEKAQALIGGAP